MEQIAHLLQTNYFGRTIHSFETLASTQDVAKELVKKGAEEGTIVLASEQTKGRGRQGKKWFSPKEKGIWMSVILYPSLQPHLLAGLPIQFARAVKRVLDPYFEECAVQIKWPNDILIHQKKISGILVEASTSYAIVGVGISLEIEKEEFPEEVKELATSMKLQNILSYSRAQMIGDLLLYMEQEYEKFLGEKTK